LICITGAAGYIGSHTALRLAQRGQPIRALIRPETPSQARAFLESLGAELVAGDALDPEVLGRALAGCGSVIHCVGGIQPPRPGDFQALHEGPARALAEAARRAPIEHIVLVSALGTRPDAETNYHRSKALAEILLSHGPWTTTIVQASLVFGRKGGLKDSKLMVRLRSLLEARRPIVLPEGGKALIQPLFVDDLARALALCASEGIASGQTIELGGPRRLSLRSWIEMLGEVLGTKAKVVSLPRPLLLGIALALERFSSRPLITVDQLRLMVQNFTAPLDSLKSTFGLEPTELEEALRESYQGELDAQAS
jgi:NADH dehydrogenase